MNLWPEGVEPGAYFNEKTWMYRPCLRKDGKKIWEAAVVEYQYDVAATQHAKRYAHRVWLEANPWFTDVLED